MHNRLSFGDILKRTALPFFLFALFLVLLLSLSWYLLIPQLTRTEISGEQRSLSQLREYHSDLQAQISSLEGKRGTFLRPVNHRVYSRIQSLKTRRSVFQSLRSDVNHAMMTLVPGKKNVVLLSHFSFDARTRKAEIRGRIANVGPRSMTVLAQFIEAIDRIPEVLDIERSRYTRVQHDDGSFSSPFTIVLTVR